jgi:hypothetical protein
MDRMLADDFALVSGSGKIYTKADLLAKACSGRMHYERQDDTDQTVRIPGISSLWSMAGLLIRAQGFGSLN